jgi:hypothetical protein
MRADFHDAEPISEQKPMDERRILPAGKWKAIHLPLMFAPARLAVGLEPLSVPDAAHR